MYYIKLSEIQENIDFIFSFFITKSITSFDYFCLIFLYLLQNFHAYNFLIYIRKHQLCINIFLVRIQGIFLYQDHLAWHFFIASFLGIPMFYIKYLTSAYWYNKKGIVFLCVCLVDNH